MAENELERATLKIPKDVTELCEQLESCVVDVQTSSLIARATKALRSYERTTGRYCPKCRGITFAATASCSACGTRTRDIFVRRTP